MGPRERIFDLMKLRGLNQKGLAEKIGISEDIVNDWSRARSATYTRRLPQIAEALGTTTEYLLTGKDAAFISDLTEEERQFLQAYRRADEHTRQIVRLTLAPFGLTLHE